MIVDPDFLDHWRTRMVVDALGGDELAPTYILRLWAHCQTRKSDRFTMPAAGLKAQCRFAGDPAHFETALIEAGFVARDGAAVHILGWADQNAALLAAWDNGAKGGRPRKPTDNPQVLNRTDEHQKETESKPTGNPSETHGEPKPNPDETDKSREDKKDSSLRSEKSRATALPRPDDVSEQVWSDWHVLRKGFKAPITETALTGARTEAAAAGMTLENFLREWCTRGTRGLKADWLRPTGQSPPRGRQPQNILELDHRKGVEADGSLI